MDVSYIQYQCADFADNMAGLLADPDGQLYVELQDVLAGFLGTPLNYLAFTVVGCLD